MLRVVVISSPQAMGESGTRSILDIAVSFLCSCEYP